ncbi:YlxR family protein [candidate division KSB1 bacterium]|nr:YlxR family protein [candidate division KSB1 bacterium]
MKTSQQQLLRLVRIDNETVVVDAARRLPGRGGYVCPKPECAELLRRKRGLHHGFRAKISEASYAAILSYVKQHDSH